jgi:hypothetical protein
VRPFLIRIYGRGPFRGDFNATPDDVSTVHVNKPQPDTLGHLVMCQICPAKKRLSNGAPDKGKNLRNFNFKLICHHEPVMHYWSSLVKDGRGFIFLPSSPISSSVLRTGVFHQAKTGL